MKAFKRFCLKEHADDIPQPEFPEGQLVKYISQQRQFCHVPAQVAILLCNIELIFETALNRKSCAPPAVGCSVSNAMSFYAIASWIHIVPI